MDILLAFPPLWNHEHPHVGLPILKAYLLKNGYPSCKIMDYNVVIMDRIVRSYLQGISKEKILIYDKVRDIMRGHTVSDKLKSGWAMNYITKELVGVGGYIYENISFDPTSFDDIVEKFMTTDISSDNNVVIKYLSEEVIPHIVKCKPQILGLSVVFSSQILYTLLICREVRRILPYTKIYLGGPQASLFWKAFMYRKELQPYIDAISIEQGEYSLKALADCWIKGTKKLLDVPNLIFRETRQNTIIETKKADQIPMKDIPMPDFTDLPLDKYCFPKLPYQMTRGCYWGRCAFCGYRGSNIQYHITPKEKVLADLMELKRLHDVRNFYFVDDAISPNYMEGIANLVIENDLDIIYSAFLRTEEGFTPELCDLLYKSGLRSVLFGFESANERVLKIMDKGMTLQTAVEILRNFKGAGIENHLSCIIGFPSETEEEAYETLNFLVDNAEIYHKAYINPFRLFSDMCYKQQEFNIENVDFLNPKRHDTNGYVSFEYSYDALSGMKIEKVIQVVEEGRKMVHSTFSKPIYFNTY